MLKLQIVMAFLCFLMVVKADILSRCELVYALRKNKIPEDKLKDWVCLIEAETGRDTDWISGPNDDGSHDFGLFRINDVAWCSKSVPGNLCKAKCSSLMGRNIKRAVNCAKQIYYRQGFPAWYGWRENCREVENLPDISVC